MKLACLQVQSFRLNLTFTRLLEDPLWYRKICMVYNGLFDPSDSYGFKNELEQQLWQLRCSQGSTPPTTSLLCPEIIKFLFPVLCCLRLAHVPLPGPLSLGLGPCLCTRSLIAAQNCTARFHCMAFVCNHSLNLIWLSCFRGLLPSEYSNMTIFMFLEYPSFSRGYNF